MSAELTRGAEQLTGILCAMQLARAADYVDVDAWTNADLADAMDAGLLVSYGGGDYYLEAISPEVTAWADDNRRWRKLHLTSAPPLPDARVFVLTEFLGCMAGIDYINSDSDVFAVHALRLRGVKLFSRRQKLIKLSAGIPFEPPHPQTGWVITGGVQL